MIYSKVFVFIIRPVASLIEFRKSSPHLIVELFQILNNAWNPFLETQSILLNHLKLN